MISKKEVAQQAFAYAQDIIMRTIGVTSLIAKLGAKLLKSSVSSLGVAHD